MVQAADLGAITNQSRTLYRGRVNVGFQAVASNNTGGTAPNPTYPGMLWMDTGNNVIKIRNSANTSWFSAGTISPNSYSWSNIPPYPISFSTGMIIATIASPTNTGYWPDGWILLNGGTIGDNVSGATTRANADCQSLFNLLWYNIDRSTAGLIYPRGSITPTSYGASAIDDWTAHKHIMPPQVMGRNLGGTGNNGTLNMSPGSLAGNYSTSVALTGANLPPHAHPLASPLPNYVSGKSSSSGGFTMADQPSGVSSTGTTGSGVPFTVPTLPATCYLNWIMKL